MRIQYFNGGLANQVFQYIFYRYGQLTTGHPEEWFLDDSFFFFKHQHNGYELEKVFGLKTVKTELEWPIILPILVFMFP